jgi:hypothetical protein
VFLRSSSASSSVADRCTSIIAIDTHAPPFPCLMTFLTYPSSVRTHTHTGQTKRPHATSTFQRAPSSISSLRSVAADDNDA